MVKDICKDISILSKVSIDATIDDLPIGNDLLDTLKFHAYECVGMACNMIGVNLNIIAFLDENENQYHLMFNPIIIERNDEYQTQESCLSLTGKRETKRYKKIVVEYYNSKFVKKKKTYRGLTAQIIQHEVDMCNGILI